jgi:O-antigen/teichoic acid export membrane protein
MAIGIYAEFYITPIFGNQWQPAIKIVELLSITALAQCLAWYFGLVLIRNGKTSLLFKLNIVFTILFFTAGLASFKLDFEDYILVQVVLINVLSIYKVFYLISKNFITYVDFKSFILPAVFSCMLFAMFSLMLRSYLSVSSFQSIWMAPIISVIFSMIGFFSTSIITILTFKKFGQDFIELTSKIWQKKINANRKIKNKVS